MPRDVQNNFIVIMTRSDVLFQIKMQWLLLNNYIYQQEILCLLIIEYTRDNQTISIYFGFDANRSNVCDGKGDGGLKPINISCDTMTPSKSPSDQPIDFPSRYLQYNRTSNNTAQTELKLK